MRAHLGCAAGAGTGDPGCHDHTQTCAFASTVLACTLEGVARLVAVGPCGRVFVSLSLRVSYAFKHELCCVLHISY